MPAPRVEIQLGKLAHNALRLRALYASRGVRITAVIKGVCGSLRVARALHRSGIRSFGDSHVANLQRMREHGIDAELMLIRSPMPSEVDRVVEFADVSLNTELSVIHLLADRAAERGKVHRVILMIELGDLREGILPSNIGAVVEEVIGVQGIELAGVGTNLGCLGAAELIEARMCQLSAIADSLQRRHGIRFDVISGGNSANHRWLTSTADTGLVNHLRIGEAILLGRETLSRERIPGLHVDAFTLVAETIELKTKPLPTHRRVRREGAGAVPACREADGTRRAVLALGRHDVDLSTIRPRIRASILGGSSDHLVLGVQEAGLEVGAEVRFDVGYGALLRAMTSPYVEKVYVP